MNPITRSQRIAQTAYSRIAARGTPNKEYVARAKRFPALIHTCGLAQAVAFGMAKEFSDYLEDLAAVLQAAGDSEIRSVGDLDRFARSRPLVQYLRLSRDALTAASWLKRYAEALGED
ncbi:MAG: type III-B CRISPR module-associated protein Cmr5 [Thermogutta sp.]